MSAVIARTTATLKMLEPTTLAYAMSVDPTAAAFMLTANSGKLVPNATTVSPTTAVETPDSTAIETAPRTKKCPPPERIANPAISERSAVSIASWSSR